MKITILTFLFFGLVCFSVSGQNKPSRKELENRGDSALMIGNIEWASRSYFEAYLFNTASERLENKFQLKDLELYFDSASLSRAKAIWFRQKAGIAMQKREYEKMEKFLGKALNYWPDSALNERAKSLKRLAGLEEKMYNFNRKILIDSAIIICREIAKINNASFFARQIEALQKVEKLKKEGLVGTEFVTVKWTCMDGTTGDTLNVTDIFLEKEKSGIVALQIGRGEILFFVKQGEYRPSFQYADNQTGYLPSESIEISAGSEYKKEDLIRVYFNYFHGELMNITFQKNAPYNFRTHPFKNEKHNLEFLNMTNDFLGDLPMFSLHVCGNTSRHEEDGKTAVEKLLLRKRRALSVLLFLVKKGVPPYRLRIKYRENNFLREEKDEVDKSINRSVVFEVQLIDDDFSWSRID